MPHILGIDPGIEGALALLDPAGKMISLIDMPTVVRKRGLRKVQEVEVIELARIIGNCSTFEPVAYLELVGARPDQGVSSMFAFGRGVGMIEGVLAAVHIPCERIAPHVWRKQTQTGAGKTGSRVRAAVLFPEHHTYFRRVKDDGRAEASLIAWCGWHRLQEVL